MAGVSFQNKSGGRRLTAAELRIIDDLKIIDPKSCRMEVDVPGHLYDISIIISPDEGCYRGKEFFFRFKFSANYPYEPPMVTCKTKFDHTYIDSEGHVGINILKGGWTPVLTISAIINELKLLFVEAATKNPLNEEAKETAGC